MRPKIIAGPIVRRRRPEYGSAPRPLGAPVESLAADVSWFAARRFLAVSVARARVRPESDCTERGGGEGCRLGGCCAWIVTCATVTARRGRSAREIMFTVEFAGSQ